MRKKMSLLPTVHGGWLYLSINGQIHLHLVPSAKAKRQITTQCVRENIKTQILAVNIVGHCGCISLWSHDLQWGCVWWCFDVKHCELCDWVQCWDWASRGSACGIPQQVCQHAWGLWPQSTGIPYHYFWAHPLNTVEEFTGWPTAKVYLESRISQSSHLSSLLILISLGGSGCWSENWFGTEGLICEIWNTRWVSWSLYSIQSGTQTWGLSGPAQHSKFIH